MNVSKRAALSIAVIGTVVLLWLCLPSLFGPRRIPFRYLVPEGYTGPLRLDYGVPGAPPLDIVDGYYEVRFDRQGKASVSTPSPNNNGWARDEYMIVGADARSRPMDRSLFHSGGETKETRFDGKEKVQREYYRAFVGTKAEYDNYLSKLQSG